MAVYGIETRSIRLKAQIGTALGLAASLGPLYDTDLTWDALPMLSWKEGVSPKQESPAFRIDVRDNDQAPS